MRDARSLWSGKRTTTSRWFTSLVIVKGRPDATIYVSFRMNRPSRTAKETQEHLDEAPLRIIVHRHSLGWIDRPQ